jgi:cysteinyl-tRNA synthetase
MNALGAAMPDDVPHATHYVDDMVALITTFLESDVAYRTSDGVYFDVSKVPDYGLLAGQPLDSLRAGARVEANEEKRSPLDFALWKKAKADEPSWPAPFGDGRPGWHTECVVMSLDLLGEDFDLHTGGTGPSIPPSRK